MISFYLGCGHCKRAKPEFTEAANVFKDDPRVALAAVDCTKHSAICSVYEVKGYPTIKYFSYLKTHADYSSGRTANEFVTFLKNPEESMNSKPVAEPFGSFPGVEYIIVLNDDNFEEEIKRYQRILIMFYAPWCGHCKSMKPDFADAARKVSNTSEDRFAVIDCSVNSQTTEKYKIKGFPTILLFEDGEQTKTYEGPRKADNFVQFLKGNDINQLKEEL